MFFPIVITSVPGGSKWGLLYAGVWLGFALFILEVVVKPLIDYKMATDPRFQLAQQQAIISNQDLSMFQYLTIALVIIGIAMIAVIIYSHREEIKRGMGGMP